MQILIHGVIIGSDDGSYGIYSYQGPSPEYKIIDPHCLEKVLNGMPKNEAVSCADNLRALAIEQTQRAPYCSFYPLVHHPLCLVSPNLAIRGIYNTKALCDRIIAELNTKK